MDSPENVTEETTEGTAAAEREARGYEVGYCRPPRATRFQKGNSGNPRGRPKGARNTATIVSEVLNARHTIKVNGRAKTMTAREIALQQQSKRAIGGCQKSLQFLFNLEAATASSQGATDIPVTEHASAELEEIERAMLTYELRRVLEANGLNEPQAAAVLGRFGLGFGSEEDRA